MNKYNAEIHHRRSIRLKEYDYSQKGLYFITISTHNRECLFGEISDGEMCLNKIGKIVVTEWEKSVHIRSEIKLHTYIVMPNHFHAIVEIIRIDNVGAYGIRPNNNENMHDVGAYGIRPKNAADTSGVCPNNKSGVCHTPLRSPSKTVGALVRGFKSAVSKQLGFSVWQRN
ncbi:MAG: transposase, partial [Culturomica sp.]|nr:transposase [Culturomica sp.]